MSGFVPISGPPGGLLVTRTEKLMRAFKMQQAAFALPALPDIPGYEVPKTFAAWPVWSDSTTKEIKYQPIPKKIAVRLWHRARDFDRRTHGAGSHGGALGHMGLKVLHTLIFDFLNFRSGQLDPSHASIARKAGVCERTVRNALNRLRDHGVINWVRRCVEKWIDGRFALEQDTNAYAVLPVSQWRGYKEPPAPPAPMPGTWGDHRSLPSQIALAAEESRAGGGIRTMVQILDADPGDALAVQLARLGQALQARNPQ
jgi:hypothetical protein